jgi:hypothetical protein
MQVTNRNELSSGKAIMFQHQNVDEVITSAYADGCPPTDVIIK